MSDESLSIIANLLTQLDNNIHIYTNWISIELIILIVITVTYFYVKFLVVCYRRYLLERNSVVPDHKRQLLKGNNALPYYQRQLPMCMTDKHRIEYMTGYKCIEGNVRVWGFWNREDLALIWPPNKWSHRNLVCNLVVPYGYDVFIGTISGITNQSINTHSFEMSVKLTKAFPYKYGALVHNIEYFDRDTGVFEPCPSSNIIVHASVSSYIHKYMEDMLFSDSINLHEEEEPPLDYVFGICNASNEGEFYVQGMFSEKDNIVKKIRESDNDEIREIDDDDNDEEGNDKVDKNQINE